MNRFPEAGPATYALIALFAINVFLVITIWIADVVTRWREAKWSTKRFTPEQYEDCIRRSAQAGVEYMRRSGGRIHFLDMVKEGKDFADDETFDRELNARLSGKSSMERRGVNPFDRRVG